MCDTDGNAQHFSFCEREELLDEDLFFFFYLDFVF